MDLFRDIHNRYIRLTDERWKHIESDHPEMFGQLEKIQAVLLVPHSIVRSRTDLEVELFYRDYEVTPVSHKFLCVVVKVLPDELFMITAYFTDTVKKGQVLWERK
jgi:hypothetical protein